MSMDDQITRLQFEVKRLRDAIKRAKRENDSAETRKVLNEAPYVAEEDD